LLRSGRAYEIRSMTYPVNNWKVFIMIQLMNYLYTTFIHKYNYSYRFFHNEDKRKVKKHQGWIPGYDYYKQFSEGCDHFNRNLHGRYWPYKRGGHGTSGEGGEVNVFIIACVSQNTYNTYCHLNMIDHRTLSFEIMWLSLSIKIFQYSHIID